MTGAAWITNTAEQGRPGLVTNAGGALTIHINCVQSKSSKERAGTDLRKILEATVSGHSQRFRRNQISMRTAITAIAAMTMK